jgi:hydrogenase nickel incorporation protein HypA/HybF
MHEVALAESIIALIEDERRRQAFSRVRMVCVHVGALGPVAPDALRFCFDAVATGTAADGAALSIVMVPGAGKCAACHRIVALADRFGACSLCGCEDVRLIAGDELRVAELEVE